MPEKPQTQSDKFKKAARAAEADPDEKRWEERLKKVARQKPAGSLTWVWRFFTIYLDYFGDKTAPLLCSSPIGKVVSGTPPRYPCFAAGFFVRAYEVAGNIDWVRSDAVTTICP